MGARRPRRPARRRPHPRPVRHLARRGPHHPLLRRALAAVGTEAPAAPAAALPDSTGAALLRDAVEHLLLRAPRAGRSRTAPLAGFVTHLARDTGVDPRIRPCGPGPRTPER
ncbi:hypothetical protein RGF97_02530 [Streptomyces roseicoloratus]|uniref:vWA-MoxR associated protein middle region 2 domain-containing protein n=1 Tax=Streptomyces roseicoloratus TaxID=2508722 RepID=A0ABY9S465_9ACTN|nr:hypothetical protein [Streptomyces roseicoloratus]WMX48728.1 hypothetical protein RGF97_02530 [Streptomyces roseicoloratus]